jgi:NADH dehydrogenase
MAVRLFVFPGRQVRVPRAASAIRWQRPTLAVPGSGIRPASIQCGFDPVFGLIDARRRRGVPRACPESGHPRAAMTIQSNSETLITIFGGSGFLGRHVVRALCKRHYRIRVAVRRPDLTNYLQPLGRVGQVHAVQANLRYADSIAAAVRGSHIVINLVGILYERGKQSFSAVQAYGAEAVAQAAAREGARLIHVSAIGADAESPSRYARSKAQGEAAALAAQPDAVVFRPSVVFGPEDDFFNKFAGMATISPVLPLIGGGETLFQPVFCGDVAEAIARAADGAAKAGTTYELGGPEIFSFRELMEIMLTTIDRRRLLMPLPYGIAKLQAGLLQYLPKPLLTPDQVELLKIDNVVSRAATREHRTLEGLGIAPHTVQSEIPHYLWRFRKFGQFARQEA